MQISLDAQTAVQKEESEDYPILLLEFNHADLTEPVRLSTDRTTRLPAYTTDEDVVYGTVSGGDEYIYVPMDITLPREEEGAAPQVRLTVSNVGRELVRNVRALLSSPNVTLRMVLASNPDQIESEMGGFIFTSVDIDDLSVSGTLMLDILNNEPYPYLTFTPATAPGLFKG